MMLPEYAQMLAELIGTSTRDTVLTSEQIAALMENLPEDLSKNKKFVVASAYFFVRNVSYFWGVKSYAFGWITAGER